MKYEDIITFYSSKILSIMRLLYLFKFPLAEALKINPI